MSYICCTPGCGNILTPQGPINMFVSHPDGSFDFNFHLDNRGRIVDSSVRNLLQAVREGDKIVSIVTSGEIDGTLDKFKSLNYSLKLPIDRTTTALTGQLV